MLYRLDQNLDLVIRTFEFPAIGVVSIDRHLDRPTERGRPETGSTVQVFRPTVNDDGSETTLVHGSTFVLVRPPV